MHAPAPVTKGSSVLNGLLAIIALALVGGAAWLFVKDIVRTHTTEPAESKAIQIAKADLKRVNSETSGWFPYVRDPIFSWEADSGLTNVKRLQEAALRSTTDADPSQPSTRDELVQMQQSVSLALQDLKGRVPEAAEIATTSDHAVSQLSQNLFDSATSVQKNVLVSLKALIESIDKRMDGWILEGDQGSDAQEEDDTDSLPTDTGLRYGNGREGSRSLSVPVSFPKPATISRKMPRQTSARFKDFGFIAYDVYVPKDCPGFVGCLFFMKDKDGLWYQARSRSALIPGSWTTLTADIRGGSPDVTPLGHQGQWDDNQLSRIRVIGITFYGDKAFEGAVLVDNFKAWLRPGPFIQMVSLLNGEAPTSQKATPEREEELRKRASQAVKIEEEPLRIINYREQDPSDDDKAGARQVKKFETFTLRFELNRQVDNPFNPEKADITCLVETPSGKKVQHIGFYYQEYDREDRFNGDALNPIGRPEWRVRITPREEGVYKYTLRVRVKQDVITAPTRTFTSIPSEHKGFIRVAQNDPRFFEFENGSFFYPIGHNLHSTVDIRCWREIFKEEPPAGRGLGMYKDFFGKMKAAGENTAEVWMASWWLGIEWTARWPNFYGPGRYSLQNAWKLDRLMEMAKEHDIHLHLVLDNHGKFSAWCDWEWDLNPYNNQTEPAGGVVSNAREFFTNEAAKKLHQQKLRYIAARWGSNPQIIGWELVSEFDLVGGRTRTEPERTRATRPNPVNQQWVREMIPYLRQCDAYGHLITNHYATDYNYVDIQLATEFNDEASVPDADGRVTTVKRPLFDYVVTDVYRPDKGYTAAAVRMQRWATKELIPTAPKPHWITEYGGDFNAAVAAALESDVHCGLWATWMTDAAGTPLFWWYDFIDRKNLYTYYGAFAKYAAGEDRRGIKGESRPISVSTNEGRGQLMGFAYRWPTGAYAWIYNDAVMKMMPESKDQWVSYGSAQSAISDLEPGKYRVEYWNCYDGSVPKTEDVDVGDNRHLQLKFPAFINNMAVKVKKL